MPDGEIVLATKNRQVRLLKRFHLQVRVIKFEVRTVESDAAPLGEQAHDSLHPFDHPAALRGCVDAEHVPSAVREPGPHPSITRPRVR